MTGCVATLADVQGYALAQYFLGLMYRDGRATPQDSVLGHMWLYIAGANGEEIARKPRERLSPGFCFQVLSLRGMVLTLVFLIR